MNDKEYFYLGFYFGCYIRQEGCLGYDDELLTPNNIGHIIDWHKEFPNDRKLLLILKPLNTSFFSDQEYSDIAEIIGYSTTGIIIPDHKEVINKIINSQLRPKGFSSLNLDTSMELTKYLCSQGYDVFSLIHKGNALDGTITKNIGGEGLYFYIQNKHE